jgi:hypothetical protein
MQWSLYDELIKRATADEAAVVAARKLWEALTGPVTPEHDLYHERSEAFVEWFLIEHRDQHGLSAVERELAQASLPSDTASPEAAAPPGWCELLAALRASQRSLFRVVRLHPGGLLLDDLLRGTRFRVDERRNLPGVLPGDLFEARLIPDPDAPYRVILGRAVLFHPREAATVLLQLAAVARRNPTAETVTAFLERLLRLRLKALTYRHVSPARIYSPAHLP